MRALFHHSSQLCERRVAGNGHRFLRQSPPQRLRGNTLKTLRPQSTTSHIGGSTAEPTLKFAIDKALEEAGLRSGPLALYEALVRRKELDTDAEQQRVMEILNAVFHGVQRRDARGVYLYGSVGCGKTMAMDLFLSSLQGCGLRIERKHFHEFLNDVQMDLHRLKQQQGQRAPKAASPVEHVAHEIADRLDVLCFDEFAITTIQDCVLLLPLFSVLFHRGVAVIATSNRAPEDLYTDGLNRHLYLPPFLDALHANCKVVHVKSTTDYRRARHSSSEDAGVFCCTPSQHDFFVDQWMESMVGHGGAAPGVLPVSFGRQIRVPQLSHCKGIARFSFDDLCRQHLSADDFMWLCRQVHTLMLDDVPILSVDDHNEARRFTLLIDHCYERHIRLIASMAGTPEEVLGSLTELQTVGVSKLAAGDGAIAGCGDGDTSQSSSGVLEAIRRIKQSKEEKASREAGDVAAAAAVPENEAATKGLHVEQVLQAAMQRVERHGGEDIDVWRQVQKNEANPSPLLPPPQVSRAWDDRRRISQFTWESADPTSEQQTIKGVFSAAVASLKESGFAVDRAISRLKEMQTVVFQEHHRLKHGLSDDPILPDLGDLAPAPQQAAMSSSL